MNIHYLQHISFEMPDQIITWAKERGHSMRGTRLFAGDELPALEGIDLLVIMGGPMSVNDEEQAPWLVGEKAFIREAVMRGIKVLGICLGAQLLANALGGRVYVNTHKEIGWFPVRLTEQGKNDALFTGFEPEFTVFQWHGETFTLPEEAVLLATSDACRNQAFKVGTNAYGLQFHMEVSERGVTGLIEHCADELVEAPFIQSREIILECDPYEQSRSRLFRLLDLWTTL